MNGVYQNGIYFIMHVRRTYNNKYVECEWAGECILGERRIRKNAIRFQHWNHLSLGVTMMMTKQSRALLPCTLTHCVSSRVNVFRLKRILPPIFLSPLPLSFSSFTVEFHSSKCGSLYRLPLTLSSFCYPSTGPLCAFHLNRKIKIDEK